MLHPIPMYADDGQSTLNGFASLGRPASRAVRAAIQHAFATSSTSTAPPGSMVPITQAQLHMPVRVGDFTDFSCSRDHVLNAGEAVFGKRILPEGFRYFPLGYGGRSSSIVLSDLVSSSITSLKWAASSASPSRWARLRRPRRRTNISLALSCLMTGVVIAS